MEDQKEQDLIRRRAYELWERQGSPEGRAEEFWEEARTQISNEEPGSDATTEPAKNDAP